MDALTVPLVSTPVLFTPRKHRKSVPLVQQTVSQTAVRPSTSPLVKATLLIASTFTVMAGATIAPALPAMQAHFAGLPNAALWVRLILTFPALFIVLGAPVAGILVDRVGRKPLLLFCGILYGLAGTSGLYTPDLTTLLIGRALLGLAVAGMMTSVTTLISDYFSGEARTKFMGYQASYMALGGTLFLTMGGWLADKGWRMPFWVYGLAFLVLPLLVTQIVEPVRAKAGSAGNAERTAQSALPVALLGFLYSMIFLCQVVFYLLPTQLPFLLKPLIGGSGSQAGLALAGLTLCAAVTSARFGSLARRVSRVPLLALAWGLMGAGYAVISQARGWGGLVPGLVLAGVGLGAIMPNLNVWLAQVAPPALRGRIMGGYATALFLGQFVSPFIGQPIVRGIGVGQTYLVFGMFALALAGGALVLRSRLTGPP